MNRTNLTNLSLLVAFVCVLALVGSDTVKKAEANTPIKFEKVGKTSSTTTIYRFETAHERCYVVDAAFGAIVSVAISCK